MRASRFYNVVKLDGFLLQRVRQTVHRREQRVKPQENAQTDGGRNRVVGALRHVHVVVRIDRFIFVANVKAEHLIGAIGNHFVHVHIVRRAGAGLERIEFKMAREFIVHHFLRGLRDGVREVGVEQTQIAVHFGGGAFDERHAPDKGALLFQMANRKIVQGALRLSAPQSVGGDLEFAHRIFFYAL